MAAHLGYYPETHLPICKTLDPNYSPNFTSLLYSLLEPWPLPSWVWNHAQTFAPLSGLQTRLTVHHSMGTALVPLSSDTSLNIRNLRTWWKNNASLVQKENWSWIFWLFESGIVCQWLASPLAKGTKSVVIMHESFVLLTIVGGG